MSPRESSTKPTRALVERAGRAAAMVHATAMLACIGGGLLVGWYTARALPAPGGPTRPVTVAIAGFIGFLASIAVLRHLWIRPAFALLRRRYDRLLGAETLARLEVDDTPAARWFETLRAATSPRSDTGETPAGRHEADGGANEGDAP